MYQRRRSSFFMVIIGPFAKRLPLIVDLKLAAAKPDPAKENLPSSSAVRNSSN
jgi:hypothetical protein